MFSAIAIWKKLLLTCSSAAPVVELVGSTWASNGIFASDFFPDVDTSQTTILNPFFMEIFIIVAWQIQNQRNNFIFKGKLNFRPIGSVILSIPLFYSIYIPLRFCLSLFGCTTFCVFCTSSILFLVRFYSGGFSCCTIF